MFNRFTTGKHSGDICLSCMLMVQVSLASGRKLIQKISWKLRYQTQFVINNSNHFHPNMNFVKLNQTLSSQLFAMYIHLNTLSETVKQLRNLKSLRTHKKYKLEVQNLAQILKVSCLKTASKFHISLGPLLFDASFIFLQQFFSSQISTTKISFSVLG